MEMANNTSYGLAAHLFTQGGLLVGAIRMAHAIEAGTTWVCLFFFDVSFCLD